MSGWWVNGVLALPDGPAILVAWCLWVIVSITLHELAHGWAAMHYGDDTPYHTGHMTWNPVVHMGVPSLVMFALVGIAWGAMPIDATRLRKRWHEAAVALAGPLMNLLLAALAIVVAALFLRFGGGLSPKVAERIQIFCVYGAMLNCVLLLFNLIPAPPLDGWRALSVFVPAYNRLFAGEGGMLFGLMLFAALFFVAGPFLFPVATDIVIHAISGLAHLIGATGIGRGP